MTVNFDLLDDAEWGGSRRAIDPSEIPPKVSAMVKRLDAEQRPVFIPCDPATQEEMTPYFKSAASLIDRQARVWAAYEDGVAKEDQSEENYIGFRVSVGKRRAAKSSTDESDSVGAE